MVLKVKVGISDRVADPVGVDPDYPVTTLEKKNRDQIRTSRNTGSGSEPLKYPDPTKKIYLHFSFNMQVKIFETSMLSFVQ